MNIAAIIQARMGSTRLPGKVLKDICGRTMLERVVDRVLQATCTDETIVATSTENRDDVVAAECQRMGVNCYRGSEFDVLDRYYQCALAYKAQIVIRITSDCPLIDPSIIDRVVTELKCHNSDYASNTLKRTFPLGLDTEVFSMEALTKAWQNADKIYQRIHVTPYIYENPEIFQLHSVINDTMVEIYRWTVDTEEDLQLLRNLYARIGDKVNFTWKDVLQIVRLAPYLVKINEFVRQKELNEG